MKQSIAWILAFSGVLALAVLVLLVFGDASASIGNFPTWLWYFFGVELLFCLVFYLFTRYYWTTED